MMQHTRLNYVKPLMKVPDLTRTGTLKIKQATY